MRQCLNAEDVLWETTLAGNEFHWDAVLGKKEFKNLDDQQ